MAAEKEFSAKVPLEEYEEFRKNFPQYGAVNWFINLSLVEFNRHVRENPTTADLVRKAIQDMVEERRDSAQVA